MKKILVSYVVMLLLLLHASCNLQNSMETKITIYLDEPIVRTGGTLIVVGRKISDDEWASLKMKVNLMKENNVQNSMSDDPKYLFLSVIASSEISIVEFVYPFSGAYSFSIKPLAKLSTENVNVTTKRILVGDGPGYTDWETGEEHKWDSVDVIHIYGPETSEERSRSVDALIPKIIKQMPKKTVFPGGVLLSPSNDQIKNVSGLSNGGN